MLDESDVGDGLIDVRECGLSDTKPLCDGSHNATADEADRVGITTRTTTPTGSDEREDRSATATTRGRCG
ncbi:CDGSH-type Zn-finger protein [Halorubrum alkaliphilum]|uniref:CDGSH-type Zn-finger protein n=1 Tax=Halorubrum alkaliphilum TaxID=261290 RepID=A0A8T4GEI3_9EURY|nr:CDGSH-type Zn-finger protein [Halorubrum alkaliphilum]